MSTDYCIVCKECCMYKCSYSLSNVVERRGNSSIIDTFHFLMDHTESCGYEGIRICRLTDDIIDECEEYESEYASFPFSDDWEPDVHNEYLQKYNEHIMRKAREQREEK